MVPGYQSSIPRPYRERVGWKGKQRETLRGEKPVRTGVLRVSPGQRVGSFRAHNPKVADLPGAIAGTEGSLAESGHTRVRFRVPLVGWDEDPVARISEVGKK